MSDARLAFANVPSPFVLPAAYRETWDARRIRSALDIGHCLRPAMPTSERATSRWHTCSGLCPSGLGAQQPLHGSRWASDENLVMLREPCFEEAGSCQSRKRQVDQVAILYPVFVQVLLTVVVYFLLLSSRSRALGAAGRQLGLIEHTADTHGAEPDHVAPSQSCPIGE